jgi:hypothetical protein
MSERVDKLISLAKEFFAAGGGVLEVRGSDIGAHRGDLLGRQPNGGYLRRVHGYELAIDSLRPPEGSTPARHLVALDAQEKVVGALSHSVEGSYVYGIGTTQELRGAGAALLMSAALSSKEFLLELNANEDPRTKYYPRIGFELISGTETKMRLGPTEVAKIERSVPDVLGL